MNALPIGRDERLAGRLSPQRLALALNALREDGYVALLDAVDVADIDALRATVEGCFGAAQAAAVPRSRRRFQLPAPAGRCAEFERLVAHPLVTQIVLALLGHGAFVGSCGFDVNCPGSAAQPVHLDAAQLWPGLGEAHPAASLVGNIPLVETTDANGSTELWPGTHRDTRFGLLVPQQVLESARSTRSPVRANLPLGSVLLRDARLWHRGTENRSSAIRIVLSSTHHISWLGRERSAKPPIARAR